MNRLLTQREKRRIDTDETILKAARDLFGQKGYTGTSLTDIAAASGVSQGLVSQRFESKEKLLTAALKSVNQGTVLYDTQNVNQGTVLSDAQSGGVTTSNVKEQLCAVVASLIKLASKDSALFAFFYTLYTAQDIPAVCTDCAEDAFMKTALAASMKNAQKEGMLPKADSWALFRHFMKNALSGIQGCRALGTEIPRPAYFLEILGIHEPGDGSLVHSEIHSASQNRPPVHTSTQEPQNRPPVPADEKHIRAQVTAEIRTSIDVALRGVLGYIGLIKKHAGERAKVADYASKAELIGSELKKNVLNMKQ